MSHGYCGSCSPFLRRAAASGVLLLSWLFVVGATHPDDHVSPEVTSSTDAPWERPSSSDPWDVNLPHAPHDTLRFETREGTWMSVDVSPDGKMLLFDLLGDLYTMPVAGGAATRLTRGMAYDMQARWSPDGRRIAYTTDRGGTENVWIMEADGSRARPVTREADRFTNSGAWSPDGEWIVVRRRLTDTSSLGTVELWMYSVLGGKGLQITKKAEWGDANEPVFSRDGRYVYFTGRPQRYAYDRNVYAGIWQIRRYDRNTGRITTLTDGAGGSGRPALSPDGRMMSFIRRIREKTVLHTYDLESGRERAVWDGLSHDNQESFAWTGVYPGCAWTPDGRAIVVYAAGGFHRVEVASGKVTRIPFTAQVEQIVTHAVRFPATLDQDRVTVRQVAWPSTSPNGKAIVFAALGRVWRYDIANHAARALSPPGLRATSPAWSPDGAWIAYASWRDSVGGHLWKMPAQGGKPVRLTNVSSQYLNPAWSRDGSKLCFLRGSGGPLREGRDLSDELWLELQWISTGAGRDIQHTVLSIDAPGSAPSVPRPSFNATGDRIWYHEYGEDPSGASQKTTLVSVRLDGTDRIEHANIMNAEEMIPSPDERWLAYRMKYDVYVTELPHFGRTPVDLEADGGATPGRRLSQDGGDWLGWTKDSRALTWSQGPVFRTLSLDTLIAAWEREQIEAAQPKPKPAKKSTDLGSAPRDSGSADSTKTALAKPKDKDAAAAPLKPDSLQISLTVPRSRPHGVAAFTGGRILTMAGGNADALIEDATLIVTGNRITAVGPRATTPVPAGAKVFDVRGTTIIPGLIDVHGHAHYANQGVLPEQFWAYRANLAYGVTTMHDPSATSWEVFTQSEMVEAGEMVGPRVFSTGNILYGAGGRDGIPVKSLDEARNHLRRMKRLGAISVKSYMQPRREQRQWILQAAREESLLVVPEGGGKFEENLGMVMDGHTGIEHALAIAPIYRDVVELFSKSRSGYTPTLLVAYGGLSGEHWFYQHADVFDDAKLRRFTPRPYLDARAIRRPVMAPDWDWHHISVAAGARRIVEAGGHVQLGAHGQRQGLGAHWELWALTQGGMRAADALKCATWNGAWYLGLDRDLGSVESGKLADFLVLERDPLADIHNSNTLRWTVKNGEVYDSETLERK
jgi:Tol biopolymer transport system component/imidazolonepropionase-like amidohydrolase